jgi:hypothetical protein
VKDIPLFLSSFFLSIYLSFFFSFTTSFQFCYFDSQGEINRSDIVSEFSLTNCENLIAPHIFFLARFLLFAAAGILTFSVDSGKATKSKFEKLKQNFI